MSAVLTLSQGAKMEFTVISNIFIDRYMPQANGSYVKVYLYLLRLVGDPSYNGTLSSVADRLEETEKDIERALKYWEKLGLLRLTRNQAQDITDIAFLPLEGDFDTIEKETAPCKEDTSPQEDSAASQKTAPPR